MNEKTKTPDARKVKTPPFRMSFPFILEPRVDPETKRTTYQITMLFPPKSNMEPFNVALRAAMAAKFGSDMKQWPTVKRTSKDVVRDFNEYNKQAKTPLAGNWEGWTIVRANCSDRYAPHVVGPIRDATGHFPRITDPRDVYGGRWANAVIEAYHFNGPKNNGVTFGLKSVQLLKHDTPFGITPSLPEDDYEDAPEEYRGETDEFERGEPVKAAETADAGW